MAIEARTFWGNFLPHPHYFKIFIPVQVRQSYPFAYWIEEVAEVVRSASETLGTEGRGQ